MPTTRAKRRARAAARSDSEGGTVTYDLLITDTFSTTSGAKSLSPSGLGGAVNSDADTWQEYRIVRLVFTHQPIGTSAPGDIATGVFVPIIDSVSTLSAASICSAAHHVYMSKNQTLARTWRVGRKTLLGNAPLRWFKTIAGNADDLEEIQGQLVSCSTSGSVPVVYTVRATIQWRSKVAPGATPAVREELRARVRQAEKEKNELYIRELFFDFMEQAGISRKLLLHVNRAAYCKDGPLQPDKTAYVNDPPTPTYPATVIPGAMRPDPFSRFAPGAYPTESGYPVGFEPPAV